MPYRLTFFFDPDFERHRLRPKNREDGSVDQFDLGYVQNVVAGQLLAAWEKVDPGTAIPEGSVVSDSLTFPCDGGCRVDPADPRRLLAAINGHVRFAGGLIAVHETLDVDHDIDFHTGNIVAIGDVRVDGSVLSGFEILGRHVTVRGTVEAARVRAMGNLTCEAGIQGGGRAAIRAGGSLRARYCENASLHAGRNILIDGSSMHCRLYAGDKLAVKGRLVGGEAYCGEAVYAGERLGGDARSQTRLVLGYDPELLHKDRHLNVLVQEENQTIESLEKEIRRGGCQLEVCGPRLEAHRRRREALKLHLARLWSAPAAIRRFSTCRVIVPGRVGANVEIGIGEAVLPAPEGAREVVFRYRDGEIIMEHATRRS